MRCSTYFFFAILFIVACGGSDSDPQIQTITEIVIQEPPPPVSRPVSIDVVASIVSGEFLVDGNAALNNPYINAEYFLNTQWSEEKTLLGESNDVNYEVMLVNGEYALEYHHIQGTQLAANRGDTLPTALSISDDGTVDINITTHTVRANFSLNGSAFPSSNYDKGIFYLQPAGGGELIELGYSNKPNDPVRVLAGTYHILWDYIQGDTVPINQMKRVQSDLVVDEDLGLNIDVTSTAMRVAFSLNGEAFPNSVYESGELYLLGEAEDPAFIGKTFEAAGLVNVIPGIYSVEYRFVNGGEIVPINSQKIILSEHDSSNPLSVDLQTVNFSLTATLNDQPFPQSAYLDGILELFDPVSASYTFLGKTWDSITDLTLISGEYDIAYSHEDGTQVPQNTRVSVATQVDATSNINAAINIVGYQVTGDISLDGNAFPASQYDEANILLRSQNASQPLFLFRTFEQDDPVMVLPGTYDVIYACQYCNNIPFNTHAVILSDLEITGDTQISADLSTIRIALTATLNGEAFPQSIYAAGNLWGGIGNKDRVLMGKTNSTQPDIILLPGNYSFWYQVNNNSFDSVPINDWALVEQRVIE